jgi:hypothetical protein
MMRISMKRVLLLAAACFFVFSLNVKAHATHTEVTCKTMQNAFSWSGVRGEYYVAWGQLGEAPRIYFYDYWSEQNYPTLIAEFNRQKGVWVFYNQAPDSLVRTIHRRWENHRVFYRSCVGSDQWRSTQYYYVPHKHHTTHPSYYHVPYRWDKSLQRR